ncbi:hypothetical protein NGUA37_04294 [Salmonella enterica]|nr:hypothetical protein NGUA37_04294 [Salmonella enterica]
MFLFPIGAVLLNERHSEFSEAVRTKLLSEFHNTRLTDFQLLRHIAGRNCFQLVNMG